LDLNAGGSVRLFDDSSQYNVIWTNDSCTGAGDPTTTYTHITQRVYTPNMSGTTGEVLGSFPGFTGSVAGLKFTTTGVPFYDDGVSSSAFTVGGPRLLVTIEDDRVLLDPAMTETTEDDKKMANCLEYLSEEGRAWLRNQIVSLNPSALAAENDILVIGSLGSGTNGGRHNGYFWGPNGNDIYESDTIGLMNEFFAPTAAVDFYEISESDYMDLSNLTTGTAAQLAFLDAYDFIIMGHSVSTSSIGSGNASRSAAWNGLSTPLVAFGQYIAGNNSSRWSWIPQGSPSDNAGTTPTEVLDVNDTGHPAFANVDVSGGTLRLFNAAPYTPNSIWYFGSSNPTTTTHFGQRSAVDDLANNNGNRIAEFQGYTNFCNIIVWDAATIGQPFYTGSPQTQGGPRALLNIMDNRNQLDPALGFGLKGYGCLAELTSEGKQMIKDLMVSMSSVPLPVELGSFELE
jgi:hypothetical protein